MLSFMIDFKFILIIKKQRKNLLNFILFLDISQLGIYYKVSEQTLRHHQKKRTYQLNI